MQYLSFIPCGLPASSRLVYRPVYPQEVVSTVPTGGKGDNRGDAIRRRAQYQPVKPLGLPPLRRPLTPANARQGPPRPVEAREETQQAQLEGLLPIAAMTQEQVIAEIALRMRLDLETENHNRMILLLMAASI